MTKKVYKFFIALTAITVSINYMSINSSAAIHARHEQTPEQAMHAFDDKPEGLGWYASAKWNEAHDMYNFFDSGEYEPCSDGVGYLYGPPFVYYATPGEPTWEGGRNIFYERIKKGTIPTYDKGVMVDPKNRKVVSSIDTNFIPQNDFTNQITLNNVISTMKYTYTKHLVDNDGTYYEDNQKIQQSIPCFEITASKPCLIEINQYTVRTDGKTNLLPNTVLFCPTDLNECISVHSETKFHTAPGKGENLGWNLFVETSDYYRNEPQKYGDIAFNLDNPNRTAEGMQKLGKATTHFMLAEGKNYIYYNSYCDTINNFVISTTDGTASIKLDCVTRYTTPKTDF